MVEIVCDLTVCVKSSDRQWLQPATCFFISSSSRRLRGISSRIQLDMAVLLCSTPFRADAPSECPTYSLLLCFFQGSIRNAVLAVAFLSLVEALPALYEASDAIVPEHHFEEHAPMVRTKYTPHPSPGKSPRYDPSYDLYRVRVWARFRSLVIASVQYPPPIHRYHFKETLHLGAATFFLLPYNVFL